MLRVQSRTDYSIAKRNPSDREKGMVQTFCEERMRSTECWIDSASRYELLSFNAGKLNALEDLNSTRESEQWILPDRLLRQF